MTTAIAKRLAALDGMNLAALQLEWRRLFRSQPPSLSRDLLMRAIGYRYQELEQGGLSKVAARKLRTIADAMMETASEQRGAPAKRESERRAAPDRPTLLPGARLIRQWHGRTHVVTVTETGFEFSGRCYRSLTEIAHEITGTHWSGPRFFGLGAAGRKDKTSSARKKAAAPSASGSAPASGKAVPHG